MLLASVISNQGLLQYSKLGNYSKGLALYEQALAIFKAIEYKKGATTTYMRMASIMRRQESKDKTITYDKSNIELCQEINYIPGLIGGLGNMGNTYGSLERTEDRKKAMKLAEKNNISRSLPTLYGNIGAAYIELNLDSALYYLNKKKPTLWCDRNGTLFCTHRFLISKIYKAKKSKATHIRIRKF